MARVTGRVAGYALARPCFEGYKIGPLFADNADIAGGLLESLFARLPGKPVSIEIPECNTEALQMAAYYGMERAMSTARMYTCTKYDLDTKRVFGLSSRVVG